MDDIASQLDMRAPLRINTGIARDNLTLEVFRTPSVCPCRPRSTSYATRMSIATVTIRDRLDAMMRYAQTASCRMRYLQEYFGESETRDCGHCDNCSAHAHGRAAAGLETPLHE